MSKIKYNNLIYSFDIETTTITDSNPHITDVYLSNFTSMDFTTGEINKPLFLRSWNEINDFLYFLNNKAKDDEKTLIFVHNLGYEFDGLIKNCEFVKKNFNNKNSLFVKSRIPLFIRLDNIEFRCSYRLLNNSIKTIGLNLGYEKLEIDYNKRYFSFSDLPAEEYEYNARDTEIVLRAIYNEKNQWDWLNDINDLPLTFTGFSRKNNQEINSIEDRKLFLKNTMYQKKFKKENIEFLERVYQGGYTHANAFFINKPLKNIHSFDLSSSYPASMLLRKYPKFFKKARLKDEYLTEYFKRIIKLNKEINSYSRPFKIAFLSKLKIENVKAKKFEKNLILPISYSKVDEPENVKIDNGRIFEAGSIIIYVNEIDFFLIQQFYDFEIKEVYNLYLTRDYEFLPHYIRNSVEKYLDEKSTLKKIKKKVDNQEELSISDFFNENVGNFIFSKDKIINILKIKGDEFKRNIGTLYQKSKEKLNSQYGINCQKLIPVDVSYNPIIDEFQLTQKDYIEEKVLYRDFVYGIYITSYSRLSLFQVAIELLKKKNINLIYSDTDSWKIQGNLDVINDVIDRYNKYVIDNSESNRYYKIGTFDYEGTYNYFSTLGCKKYINADKKKVYVTIAGINKHTTSENLSILYKDLNYDFSLFCKIAFSINTIYDYSITGKLLTKYYDNNYFKIVVKDENGKSGLINGYSMLELVESDYVLMNSHKISNKIYINHCEKLQNRKFDFENVLIYKNCDEIQFKYLTIEEVKKLKLYEEINHEFEGIVKG